SAAMMALQAASRACLLARVRILRINAASPQAAGRKPPPSAVAPAWPVEAASARTWKAGEPSYGFAEEGRSCTHPRQVCALLGPNCEPLPARTCPCLGSSPALSSHGLDVRGIPRSPTCQNLFPMLLPVTPAVLRDPLGVALAVGPSRSLGLLR